MRRMVLVAIATLILGSVSSVPAAEKIVLKVGHDSSTTHPYQTFWARFKEVLEAETRQAVEVQIFPDAQLGDEPRMLEGLRLGTLDGQTISSGSLAPFVPEIDLLHLPFLFRDVPHLLRVLDGPIGGRLTKTVEARTGAVVLGWISGAPRLMWNKKRPIHRPEDLKGLKLRVQTGPLFIDTFNALGAQATIVSFAELYTALQQGVVDGSDQDAVDILTLKFYEVTKYVAETNHGVGSRAFLFSKKRFDRLAPAVQNAVLKAGQDATAAGRKATEDLVQTATVQLKQKGLQFNTVDLKPFRDLVQPVYSKHAKRVGGIELIEEVAKQ
jgi:tripartite ATP-independent transporter DctP family solute receptor